MDEKFSITKFLDFSPMAFVKIGGLGIKIFIVVLLVFGGKAIIDKIFPAPPQNMNQPEIHIKKGGTAHYTVIQQAEKKRPWYMPSPFVEVFGELKTDRDNPDFGTRFGARWDF